jgi:hypothetical protein
LHIAAAAAPGSLLLLLLLLLVNVEAAIAQLSAVRTMPNACHPCIINPELLLPACRL